MKKKLSFVLLAFVIILTACSQNGNKDKQEDKQVSNENKETKQNSNENNSPTTDEDTEDSQKDTEDSETDKIVNMQMDAKKNAQTYVDLAFSYKLGTEYTEYKDIFSKSMYNQLAKNDYETKEQDNRDKIDREVKDIKIYFNDEEDIPQKALFTAIYKVTDDKEKNIIQRQVTGEIEFVEENGVIKIDGSQIIKTAENDKINAYE